MSFKFLQCNIAKKGNDYATFKMAGQMDQFTFIKVSKDGQEYSSKTAKRPRDSLIFEFRWGTVII